MSVFSSGLEAAILILYSRSGETAIPMGGLGRVFEELSDDVLNAILFAV